MHREFIELRFYIFKFSINGIMQCIFFCIIFFTQYSVAEYLYSETIDGGNSALFIFTAVSYSVVWVIHYLYVNLPVGDF